MSYFQCPKYEQTHVFSHGGAAAAGKVRRSFLGGAAEFFMREGDAGKPVVVAKPDSPEPGVCAHLRKVAAQVSIANLEGTTQVTIE